MILSGSASLSEDLTLLVCLGGGSEEGRCVFQAALWVNHGQSQRRHDYLGMRRMLGFLA